MSTVNLFPPLLFCIYILWDANSNGITFLLTTNKKYSKKIKHRFFLFMISLNHGQNIKFTKKLFSEVSFKIYFQSYNYCTFFTNNYQDFLKDFSRKISTKIIIFLRFSSRIITIFNVFFPELSDLQLCFLKNLF